MRYIKKYENYSSDIKKYAVIKYIGTNIDYFIDEIEEIKYDDVVCYKISYQYNYNTNNIDKLKVDAETSRLIDEYKKEMLFTSDNLKDCMDFLIEYLQANKYNL